MSDKPLDQKRLLTELNALSQEHKALDAAVEAMHSSGVVDQLKIMRLKKRKLEIKDRVAWIEDNLTPDIIA